MRNKLLLLLIISTNLIFASNVDPSFNSAGARALGIGNAFSAIADDHQAIFANPAGLAFLHEMQFGVMQNTKMDIVNNLNFNGIIPLEKGVFGFSMYNSGAADIALTGKTIYGRTFQTGTSGYYNSLYVGSYASKFNPNLAFGINGKLFTEGIYGDSSSSAMGFNADLGLLYQVNNKIMTSLVLKNPIPLGLAWNTGKKENIETQYVIGGKFNLIGSKPEDSFLAINNQKAILGTDLVINNRGTLLYNYGVEYTPFPSLALRAGINSSEEALTNTTYGIASRLSLGLGINIDGIGFDYAYVKDNLLDENLTHYFSMSYKFIEPKKAEPVKEVKRDFYNYVHLESPQDKLVTFEDTVAFSGSLDAEVASILLNDKPIRVSKQGFSESYSLKNIGKNVVRLTALDKNGGLIAYKDIRILKMATFKDVPESHWANEYITKLATTGLINGYPGNVFKPENNISRAEFTKLMAISIGLNLNMSSDNLPFSDLYSKYWATKYILAAYQENIVKGFPNKTFRPQKSITRAEGVTAIIKLAKTPLDDDFSQVNMGEIKDKHWASIFIKAALKNDLISLNKDGKFNANQDLTRAEVAKMFFNTQLGDTLVKDLYNWDSYKYIRE